MPTPNLKRENDYKSFSNFQLNATNWNLTFSDPDNGIGPRLRALEARDASVQEFIDLGTTLVVQLVADNISPYLVTLQGNINDLVGQVDAAQAAVDHILQGGIPAANLTVAPITGLTATNGQAAFAEFKVKIDAGVAAATAAADQAKSAALVFAIALG